MEEEILVRRRRVHRENLPSHFLRNYRVELLWLLIIVVGVFLLLKQANLRSFVTLWAGDTAHRLLRKVR